MNARLCTRTLKKLLLDGASADHGCVDLQQRGNHLGERLAVLKVLRDGAVLQVETRQRRQRAERRQALVRAEQGVGEPELLEVHVLLHALQRADLVLRQVHGAQRRGKWQALQVLNGVPGEVQLTQFRLRAQPVPDLRQSVVLNVELLELGECKQTGYLLDLVLAQPERLQ